MLESEVQKATGSYRTYSSLVKLRSWLLSLRWKTAFGRTAALVPALAVMDLPLGRTLMMMKYDYSRQQNVVKINGCET